jgi:hypothetical protein
MQVCHNHWAIRGNNDKQQPTIEKVVKQIFLSKQGTRRCGPYLDKCVKIDDETNCGMKLAI